MPLQNSLRRSIVTICLSAALPAMVNSALAETTLRWKFKEGNSTTYEMQQKMEMAMKAGAQDFKTTTTQTMDLTWTVRKVNEDGSCEMSQTIDRIRFQMEGPTGKVEYDSKIPPAKDANPVLAMIGPMFSALVGAEFQLKMDPLGHISDLQMPKKFEESLQGSQVAQMGGMGPDAMKQMIQQSGLILPEQPIDEQYKWTSNMEVKVPFGQMSSTNTMTYLGAVKDKGSALDKIGVKTDIELVPNPESKIDVAITDQQVDGLIHFDNAQGHIHSSTIKQSMVMQIKAQNQTFDQNIKQTVAMRLKPKVEARTTN